MRESAKRGWGCCNYSEFKVQLNFDPYQESSIMQGTTSFREKVKSSGGVGITKEVCLGPEKFILFTRLSQGSDQWVIG